MIRFNDILEKIRFYHPDVNLDELKKAYVLCAKAHKGKESFAGEPYLKHSLQVAYILTQLRMDVDTVITGLLHDIFEKDLVSREALASLFGSDIAELVDGVTQIGRMTFHSTEERQAENFRKMLLATARDIRVVIVTLADRLDSMRTLDQQPPRIQLQVAREAFDIYAPLANRLGISWIKCELEDNSFRYLEPEIYYDLATKINRRKAQRDEYIEEARKKIELKLAEHGMAGAVSGRAKHLYSVYHKMERQGINLDQVYDLAAFRIIVPELSDCYVVLGIIHSTWKPIPGRFKDYIAMPKANMYQSLHTTVIGPYGERMEVQIRTEEMHRVAEEGIAAHWKYKESGGGTSYTSKDDRQFAWLRQLVEWQQEVKDSKEFMRTVKLDLLSDSVYVFTPGGEVKELPRGSTPIDFAFSIHSELGMHCSGAKVNGKLLPLRTELKNGNIVEIITSAHQTPSKDWLAFVKTSKARNKIRQWVKAEQRGKSIEVGRELLEKKLRKYGLGLKKTLAGEAFLAAVSDLGFKEPDDLLASLGYGKVSLGQILTRVVPAQEKPEPVPKEKTGESGGGEKASSGIKIQGMGDIMFRFAKCCNPVQGDPVVGFITRGRGITVHTADCPRIQNDDPERYVKVEWDLREGQSRSVSIRVCCYDRKGILAAITNAITDCEANILSASVSSRKDDQGVNLFEIEVKDLEQLNRAINAVKNLEDVFRVERVRG